jgi:hypothetical protein
VASIRRKRALLPAGRRIEPGNEGLAPPCFAALLALGDDRLSRRGEAAVLVGPVAWRRWALPRWDGGR